MRAESTVSRHPQHPAVAARWVAAQTRLGVAQPPAGGAAEEQGREVVADAAARGHGSGELADAERHAAGLPHAGGDGGDVVGRVLPVGVGADDVGLGPALAGRSEAGAQGLARLFLL